MGRLYDEYLIFKDIPSGINEHLPLLYNLALDCESTIEFGVGYGRSTRAFIAALEARGGSHISYEVKLLEGVSDLFARASIAKLNARLILKSTLLADVPSCDMLLVDSHHTYDQVKGELELHGNKVKKYICFHDTVLYGEHGQDPGTGGINKAIDEFMLANLHWVTKYMSANNNGMLVIERIIK